MSKLQASGWAFPMAVADLILVLLGDALSTSVVCYWQEPVAALYSLQMLKQDIISHFTTSSVLTVCMYLYNIQHLGRHILLLCLYSTRNCRNYSLLMFALISKLDVTFWYQRCPFKLHYRTVCVNSSWQNAIEKSVHSQQQRQHPCFSYINKSRCGL